MIVALGADHRGMEVRRHLLEWFRKNEYEVNDMSPSDSGPIDYPDIAYAVADSVSRGIAQRGVLIGGTGIGMCMTANKIATVRAVLVRDEIGAEMSRHHNDANVLCLSADMLGMRIIDKIMVKWLTTEFAGGRHARRVQKITAIERGLDPSNAGSATDSATVAD